MLIAKNGLHRALREAGEGALNAGRRCCLEPSIEEQTVIKWGDEIAQINSFGMSQVVAGSEMGHLGLKINWI